MTTTRCTHATPAAAYASAANRYWEADSDIPEGQRQCKDIGDQLVTENDFIRVRFFGGVGWVGWWAGWWVGWWVGSWVGAYASAANRYWEADSDIPEGQRQCKDIGDQLVTENDFIRVRFFGGVGWVGWWAGWWVGSWVGSWVGVYASAPNRYWEVDSDIPEDQRAVQRHRPPAGHRE